MPGEYFISKRPVMFETLVGSCVCVCIYNVTNNIAAMNHFLQSQPRTEDDLDIGHYGSSSTEYIIEKLFVIDNAANHYKAEIFGGAAVIKSLSVESNIGKENIEVAHKVLKKFRIRIARQEVGGQRGRRIKFDTGTMKIFCRFAGQVAKKFNKV